jgi:restriction system protein
MTACPWCEKPANSTEHIIPVWMTEIIHGTGVRYAIERYSDPWQENLEHSQQNKWLSTETPRSAFDQDLLYSMGTLLTVASIDRPDGEKRILAAATGSGLSSGALAVIVDEAEPQSALDLGQLARDQIRERIGQRFRGHDLARLVNEVLKAQGYQTSMSPPGRDGGVDILAAQGVLGFDHPRLCAQVKSTNQTMTVSPLRELSGVMKRVKADYGLFVSWGGFNLAVHRENKDDFFEIRLWDAEDLIDALVESYERLPKDIQTELPLKRTWILVPDEVSVES